MTAENFVKVMPRVFAEEGAYSNNPKDPGGATNLGITARTLGAWRGGGIASSDAVKALGKDEATAIYRAQYWNAIMGDQLPAGVDYAVMDFAVNSGSARAAKALQKAIGCAQDGHIGMQTVASAKGLSAAIVAEKVCDIRLAFLKSLPTWGSFGKGWEARVARVRAYSVAMAQAAVPPAMAPTMPAPEPEPEPDLVVPRPEAAITPPSDAARPPELAAPSMSGTVQGIGAAVAAGGGASVLSYIQSPYALAALALLVVAGGIAAYLYFRERKRQGS